MSGSVDLNDYFCVEKGLVFPIINEYTWSTGVRAFVYLLGMLWCFLGLAIVADVFMVGIEKITSKTKIIQVSNPQAKDGLETIEVKVWNDIVANLSLMAFGTSAPEILLNVIQICGNQFKSGDLGPATIVGSAAFNLLLITAICVASIPNGEVRKINSLPVYAVTSIFSMFSYVWLILVLVVITPDVVDLWEAIVTFLMFPALIVVSYMTDRCRCCRVKNKTASEVEIGIGIERGAEIERGGSADIIHLAKELGRHNIPEDEAAKMAAAKLAETRSHNKGWYRIEATRNITGGHRLIPIVKQAFKDLYHRISLKEIRTTPESNGTSSTCVSVVDLSEDSSKAVVEFSSAATAVMENAGKVRLGIRRYGRLNIPVTVRVETIDGTAEANSDYVAVKTKVGFSVNETLREISISIIDDDVWEPDEFFFAKLFLEDDDENADQVIVGSTSINQITIINDDQPGCLEFTKPSYVVREGLGKAQLFVHRVNGADGRVTVAWRTADMSALHRKDYIGGSGTLVFDHGETQKAIDITILDTDLAERDCSFMLELHAPTDGARLGKIAKSVVTLVNDDDFNGMVARIAAQTKENLDALRLESATWREQFYNAMNVNGGDVENAGTIDYVMHFISFFWKVLFAFIPPPSVGGGWLTFIFSLIMIGVLTLIVGDLASTFGCLIGLNDIITAITFVALGTSMPDTFASRQAALHEKYADSSIGNINGSNAVNVFLGLGLPWLIAAAYWKSKGQQFDVPSNSLSFSVVLYLSCAVCAIVILMLRRRLTPVFGGAELGGSRLGKYFCAAILVLLWVFYIVMSSLQSESIISASF